MAHEQITFHLLECVEHHAHENQQRSTSVEACELVVDAAYHCQRRKDGDDGKSKGAGESHL